jgi:hypothetical protein
MRPFLPDGAFADAGRPRPQIGTAIAVIPIEMESYKPIAKHFRPGEPPPNLVDYAAACRGFSWAEAAGELNGLPGGRGLNIAYEAVDRHASGLRRDHVAIRWLGKNGERVDLRYADLAELSARFARALEQLGVRPGDRVYALLGRTPELYVAALGTLKHRAIFCPMFSAFGPEPVRARMSIGEARVLVTTARLYARKVAPIRSEIPPTAPEDPALLHFTSGTTGTPKGALHVHGAGWPSMFRAYWNNPERYAKLADPGLERHERLDDLARDRIRASNHGRLGDHRMRKKRAFHLERADQVPGALDEISRAWSWTAMSATSSTLTRWTCCAS